jgi:hypothetical protein
LTAPAIAEVLARLEALEREGFWGEVTIDWKSGVPYRVSVRQSFIVRAAPRHDGDWRAPRLTSTADVGHTSPK